MESVKNMWGVSIVLLPDWQPFGTCSLSRPCHFCTLHCTTRGKISPPLPHKKDKCAADKWCLKDGRLRRKFISRWQLSRTRCSDRYDQMNPMRRPRLVRVRSCGSRDLNPQHAPADCSVGCPGDRQANGRQFQNSFPHSSILVWAVEMAGQSLHVCVLHASYFLLFWRDRYHRECLLRVCRSKKNFTKIKKWLTYGLSVRQHPLPFTHTPSPEKYGYIVVNKCFDIWVILDFFHLKFFSKIIENFIAFVGMNVSDTHVCLWERRRRQRRGRRRRRRWWYTRFYTASQQYIPILCASQKKTVKMCSREFLLACAVYKATGGGWG